MREIEERSDRTGSSAGRPSPCEYTETSGGSLRSHSAACVRQNRADEKRQAIASQEWQSVPLEEQQNEQLLDLSKQILELTDAIHRLTVEHTRRSPLSPSSPTGPS